MRRGCLLGVSQYPHFLALTLAPGTQDAVRLRAPWDTGGAVVSHMPEAPILQTRAEAAASPVFLGGQSCCPQAVFELGARGGTPQLSVALVLSLAGRQSRCFPEALPSPAEELPKFFPPSGWVAQEPRAVEEGPLGGDSPASRAALLRVPRCQAAWHCHEAGRLGSKEQ